MDLYCREVRERLVKEGKTALLDNNAIWTLVTATASAEWAELTPLNKTEYSGRARTLSSGKMHVFREDDDAKLFKSVRTSTHPTQTV